MRLFILSTSFLLLSFLTVQAQHFSEDKIEFRSQVISRLKRIGTEVANKIAFDFQNAWDGKFTVAQQDKAHKIALTMQKKGHQFYPYFYHYFSYLAYSVAQENLQRDELNSLLTINEQVVETLSKGEYADFVFGLNIYFARRYLSLEKTLTVQAPGGSYSFKLFDEFLATNPDEEILQEDASEFITDDELADFNNAQDDFSNDSWSTQDDDSWDNSNASWGNSNDDWGTDDSWNNDAWGNETEEVYEEAVPERPAFVVAVLDHVLGAKSKYLHPELKGPAIQISGAKLLIFTPNDSMKIKNTDGVFLLQSRTFAGTSGSIEWPEQNRKFRGAVVQLGEFNIRKDRSDFWTPNATLRYEDFSGEIDGVFKFKSKNRPKRALSNFPVFTSNENDVTVKLGDEKLSYIGGVELQGNNLFGRSVSQKHGTLKILDGRGNEVILKSKFFTLGDSLVSMDNGSITILHGGDSIYHKEVRAKYDIPTNTLSVLRNSGITPYLSSYFDVSINLDLIKWDMKKDSLRMEVMNGKDLVPATFESKDFFDNFRYKKLARFLDFHPINSAVFYARKYGVTEFYIGEMVVEYELDDRFAKASAKILKQYGFADYNEETGLLKLYDKAFLYYDASAQKVDFDNLMIPSKISDGPNGYLSLDSGQLKVRGVPRFYVTTNFKIYAAPYDSTVTLLKGRNIEFDGTIHAGGFEYQGVGHQFDYEEFLFNMPTIDSMKITVSFRDTTNLEGGFERAPLQNQVTSTSGTLYVNKKENKSGVQKEDSYPFFISESNAVIYFDGQEILNGAYDKSVKYVVPPFELDSLEREHSEAISFDGTFNSGGIFPPFDEILHLQGDRSLGFNHQIPDEGYNLYGTDAKTYEEIRLSNQGMRGHGQIDFLTTTIYSNDFIYYPDSVTTNGISGVISPGTIGNASYPEAVLGPYDMYWLPRKDSMYLRNVGEPFKFYHSTAELDGEANITTKGVYGSGTMLTRGSRAVSKELNFHEFKYGARHATFEVLTEDAGKPAIEGDDVRLNFDLTNNTAVIKPEVRGVPAISFPYAQMKTSITEAIWDLADSTVSMTKAEGVPIEDSYFFTTREDLDSLAFNAERAVYDINSQELNVKGIPYIIVADSKIIPENNETTILANSVLQKFDNAEIIIDTLNSYHYLDRASIRVISSKKFEGNAWYKQIIGKDTFDIRFHSFALAEVPVGVPDRKGKVTTRLMTVSGGEVSEKQKLIISPGFVYKGSVSMFAYKKALELDGLVKLDVEENNNWVYFRRTDEETNVQVPFDDAQLETEERARAGLHKNIRDEFYTTFVETRQADSDIDFFNASGLLSYSHTSNTYKIETSSKSIGESYEGSTMVYADSSKSVIFEGPVAFFSPSTTDMTIKASALGIGNKATNEYKADVMMVLDFKIASSVLDIMALDLTEIIERMGPTPANDISLGSMYKLANITGDATAKLYEVQSLKNYTSLVSTSKKLEKPVVISNVNMKWNKEYKAWHSTTKIGLSNIMQEDLNAKLDGFIEIKKDETGADVLNLFLQVAPGIWYYIGYSQEQLVMFSSNPAFNAEVNSQSSTNKVRPGETIFVKGDQNETLSFINAFRLNYLGVKEPYNLVFPDDVSLEDESFDSIEKKEDDDGFGF